MFCYLFFIPVHLCICEYVHLCNCAFLHLCICAFVLAILLYENKTILPARKAREGGHSFIGKIQTYEA